MSVSVSDNQIAKTGTIIPNRIFVGGIAPETTDNQLKEFFSSYGAVKDTKIICDRSGASKGYGFVTFETQEDADKMINKKECANLIFKDRKLNIGPAVRKQQVFNRLVDGMPAVSAATTMLLASGAYGYATPGGLAMMAPEAYTQALQQQQVPPQVAAANYSNMILPAQLPLYMPQSYSYGASSMQGQMAGTAQTLPYGTHGTTAQWPTTARCFQPTPGTCVSNPPTLYPDSLALYNANNQAQQVTHQYLEMSEGTMHESNSNDVEIRCSSAPTNVDALHGQPMTSLMSLQPGRPLHQPHHFHGATSPQPPPIKKMASHYPVDAIRCFTAPLMASSVQPAAMLPGNVCTTNRGPSLAVLAPNGHVKFEHDSRLAANIAPPTPPATPAGGNN